MSKFKVGDHVVVIVNDVFHPDYSIGSTSVVSRNDQKFVYLKMDLDGVPQRCHESHIEHWVIYDSPLMKALR